jgi:crotonobetainyl-CoA:carnitine CoA-transferase CaiB-like acyl-CoA transferase
MKHPLKEKLTVIGSPIKLSRTPVEYKKAPPMLGEHTDEILSGILDEEKIAELRQKGIIG